MANVKTKNAEKKTAETADPAEGSNEKLWKDLYQRSGKVFLTVGKTRVKISKYNLWEQIDATPDSTADFVILNPATEGDFELVVL